MQQIYLMGSKFHRTLFGKMTGMAHCWYQCYIYAPDNGGELDWKLVMDESS